MFNQANSGINQPSTSNSLFNHRNNELPFSTTASTPSSVASSFVLDMPAGEMSSTSIASFEYAIMIMQLC